MILNDVLFDAENRIEQLNFYMVRAYCIYPTNDYTPILSGQAD